MRNQVRRIARLAAAVVWLHQGLWCKTFGRDGHHAAIIESIPGLPAGSGPVVTRGLGLVEGGLGVLVAFRGDRRSMATLQTAVVGAFNAGGLVVGRTEIAHPARLLARNIVFLGLVWGAVDAHR